MNHAPVGSEYLGNLAPREPSCPARHEQPEGVAGAMLAVRPGEKLDGDAASWAIDTLVKYQSSTTKPTTARTGTSAARVPCRTSAHGACISSKSLRPFPRSYVHVNAVVAEADSP